MLVEDIQLGIRNRRTNWKRNGFAAGRRYFINTAADHGFSRAIFIIDVNLAYLFLPGGDIFGEQRLSTDDQTMDLGLYLVAGAKAAQQAALGGRQCAEGEICT